VTAGLVDAWRKWDHWSISTRSARWRSKKGSRPPGRDRDTADRLTTALIVAADKIGVTHMVLHDRIAQGRRDGLSVEAAVARATHTPPAHTTSVGK